MIHLTPAFVTTALIALAGTLALTSAALAETYYIAPDGNDDGPGSEQQPWASLNHAAATAKAGDRVLVRDGVYRLTERVTFANSGTADAWIEYVADGEAVFDASGIWPHDNGETSKGAIHLEGASYIRLIGLELRNSYGFGIGIFGPSTHIDIVDCTVDTTFAPAIGAWNMKYLRVVGNEITNANTQQMRVYGSRRREAPHEAISVAGVEFFEVAWNHVHHNVKEGIDVKEISRHGVVHHNYVHHNPRQGLYADAWFGLLTDVEFYSNVSHDNEWGAVVSVEGRESEMRDVRIHHNLFYNNRASGMYFGTWGGDGPRSGLVIEHNTIWNNGQPEHWAGPTGSIDVRAKNVRDTRIVNNICAEGGAFEIATTVGPDDIAETLDERGIFIGYNLIESEKNDNDAEAIYGTPHAFSGEPVIVADPGLVDPQNGDFRLQEGSPAVDAGEDGADIGALPLGENKLPAAKEPPIAGQGFPDYTPHRFNGWPDVLVP